MARVGWDAGVECFADVGTVGRAVEAGAGIKPHLPADVPLVSGILARLLPATLPAADTAHVSCQPHVRFVSHLGCSSS